MSAAEWILFLLALTAPGRGTGTAISNDTRENAEDGNGRIVSKPPQQCASRIEATMESMKKRHDHHNSAELDLAGYALHQPLRTAPFDMYVTRMRVRMPAQPSWFRVERCVVNARNRSMETQLSFRDLSVSGLVKLYGENAVLEDPLLPLPADVCNMTLRLRGAGLGVSASARRGAGPVDVRTVARFLQPAFVSVYAYGCRPPRIEHREDVGKERRAADFSQEVEDVFIRGIQTLLATYMEKRLQPALKETLMTNIGYTLSYGR